MMSWLNPKNWIKSGVASVADAKIEEYVQAEKLSEGGRDVVNYLIQLSESRADDTKARAISQDLIYCGESLIELGRAIDPSGPEGRKLSKEEAASFNARVKVLFGDIIHEWNLADAREWMKKKVRDLLGIA